MTPSTRPMPDHPFARYDRTQLPHGRYAWHLARHEGAQQENELDFGWCIFYRKVDSAWEHCAARAHEHDATWYLTQWRPWLHSVTPDYSPLVSSAYAPTGTELSQFGEIGLYGYAPVLDDPIGLHRLWLCRPCAATLKYLQPYPERGLVVFVDQIYAKSGEAVACAHCGGAKTTLTPEKLVSIIGNIELRRNTRA